MQITFKDRIVLVTGGGRGLGRAICQGFADAGAAVVVTDRDEHTASATASVDVSDRDACRALALLVAREAGPVDVLVNNAGVARGSDILDPASVDPDWDAAIAINLTGVYNATTAWLPQLVERRGAVVNVASIQSFVARPGSVPYTVSKTGVRGFTTAMAVDLAAHGVRVNAIAPGLIETPMSSNLRANANRLDSYLSHTPMGRVAKVDDVVGPVLFLASDQARFVAGVTLPVDGGFLAV